MTRSELMTIMVCGMAHIAGGVAAVHAAMGMAAGYSNTPATVPRTTANSVDAICRGAGDGFHLALNIIAMLIAFIAGATGYSDRQTLILWKGT